MELKDWMQLITSWVAIGVTIWVELHKSDEPKRRRRRKPDKRRKRK